MTQQGREAGKRQVVDAALGYVRALSGTRAPAERGWVDCPRHGTAVEMPRCLSCRDCASISWSKAGRIDKLRCYKPDQDEVPRREHHGLMVDVPTAADVMTRNVVGVQPDLSLDGLLSLLTEHGFKALPVIADDGNLLGTVSESDALAYLQAHRDEGARDDSLGRDGDFASMHTADALPCVEEVMLPLALTVPEDVPLTQAAALMAFEGIHRLIVRNPDGQVVGLLSASDVLGWLGEAGGYGA